METVKPMVPHKLRKTRKKRGSRTHGWGQVGQHRKKSVKGGRKVGRHKHLWTYVIKHEPEYFGKKGFKSPKSLKGQIDVINVGQLNELVTKLEIEKQLKTKRGKPFIDLEKLGYHKLLGTGKITKAINVKVPFCSEKAVQKIEEAGGKIIEKPKLNKVN
jgi:large subunit ribosomal protein L15